MRIFTKMESTIMMNLTISDLLDAFEQTYQYKAPETGSLIDFRCLTEKDGEVYIEYRVGIKQINVWVNMNDNRVYKRVISVSDIQKQPIHFYERDNHPQPEMGWEPQGSQW